MRLALPRVEVYVSRRLRLALGDFDAIFMGNFELLPLLTAHTDIKLFISLMLSRQYNHTRISIHRHPKESIE